MAGSSELGVKVEFIAIDKITSKVNKVKSSIDLINKTIQMGINPVAQLNKQYLKLNKTLNEISKKGIKTVNAEIKKQKKNLTGLNKAFNNVTKTTKTVKKSQQSAKKSISDATSATRKATKSTKDLAKEMRNMTQSAKKSATETGKVGASIGHHFGSTSIYKNITNVSKAIGVELAKGSMGASLELMKLAKASGVTVNKFDVLKGMAGQLGRKLLVSLGKASKQMIKMGAIQFGKFLIDGVKSAGDVEIALEKLGAMTQKTGKDLQDLKQIAIDVGEATKFTTSDMIEAQTNLAQLGLITKETTTEQARELTEAVGYFAVATDESIQHASAWIGAVNQAVGLSAKKSAEYMYYVANNSAIAQKEVSQVIARYGTMVRTQNQSVESLLGLSMAVRKVQTSSKLTARHIKGFGDSLIGVHKSAIKMAEMKSVARAIGKEDLIYDAQGNMRDMVDIIADLEQSYTKLGYTQEQINLSLSTMFNKTAVAVYQGAVAEGIDKIRDNTQKLMTDSVDSVDKAAEAMGSTFNGLVERIKGKFDNIRTAIGESLLDGAKEGARSLLDALNELDLSQLTQTIQNLVNPLFKVFSALVKILNTTVLPLINDILSALQPIIDTVLELALKILPLIGNMLRAVVPIISTLADIIGTIVATLTPILEQLFTQLTPILGYIAELIQKIWELIKPIVEVILKALMESLKPIFEIVLPMIVSSLEWVMTLLEPIIPIVQFIADILGAIFDFVNSIREGLLGWLKGLLGISKSSKQAQQDFDAIHQKAVDIKADLQSFEEISISEGFTTEMVEDMDVLKMKIEEVKQKFPELGAEMEIIANSQYLNMTEKVQMLNDSINEFKNINLELTTEEKNQALNDFYKAQRENFDEVYEKQQQFNKLTEDGIENLTAEKKLEAERLEKDIAIMTARLQDEVDKLKDVGIDDTMLDKTAKKFKLHIFQANKEFWSLTGLESGFTPEQLDKTYTQFREMFKDKSETDPLDPMAQISPEQLEAMRGDIETVGSEAVIEPVVDLNALKSEFEGALKTAELRGEISGDMNEAFEIRSAYYTDLIENAEQYGLTEEEILNAQLELQKAITESYSERMTKLEDIMDLEVARAEYEEQNEVDISELKISNLNERIRLKQSEISALGSNIARERELIGLLQEKKTLMESIDPQKFINEMADVATEAYNTMSGQIDKLVSLEDQIAERRASIRDKQNDEIEKYRDKVMDAQQKIAEYEEKWYEEWQKDIESLQGKIDDLVDKIAEKKAEINEHLRVSGTITRSDIQSDESFSSFSTIDGIKGQIFDAMKSTQQQLDESMLWIEKVYPEKVGEIYNNIEKTVTEERNKLMGQYLTDDELFASAMLEDPMDAIRQKYADKPEILDNILGEIQAKTDQVQLDMFEDIIGNIKIIDDSSLKEMNENLGDMNDEMSDLRRRNIQNDRTYQKLNQTLADTQSKLSEVASPNYVESLIEQDDKLNDLVETYEKLRSELHFLQTADLMDTQNLEDSQTRMKQYKEALKQFLTENVAENSTALTENAELMERFQDAFNLSLSNIDSSTMDTLTGNVKEIDSSLTSINALGEINFTLSGDVAGTDEIKAFKTALDSIDVSELSTDLASALEGTDNDVYKAFQNLVEGAVGSGSLTGVQATELYTAFRDEMNLGVKEGLTRDRLQGIWTDYTTILTEKTTPAFEEGGRIAGEIFSNTVGGIISQFGSTSATGYSGGLIRTIRDTISSTSQTSNLIDAITENPAEQFTLAYLSEILNRLNEGIGRYGYMNEKFDMVEEKFDELIDAIKNIGGAKTGGEVTGVSARNPKDQFDRQFRAVQLGEYIVSRDSTQDIKEKYGADFWDYVNVAGDLPLDRLIDMSGVSEFEKQERSLKQPKLNVVSLNAEKVNEKYNKVLNSLSSDTTTVNSNTGNSETNIKTSSTDKSNKTFNIYLNKDKVRGKLTKEEMRVLEKLAEKVYKTNINKDLMEIWED